jgi:leader peptidase (prepilin peptidase) / N-methyltransferase
VTGVPALGEFPFWFLASVAVSVGLAFGSFLNVVIHRLPRDENLAHPPSRCPACGARIAPWDNVPVLSWLLLRGRARCCQARISPRYPLVEALGGALAYAVLDVIVLELPPETSGGHALGVFAVHLALGLGLVAAIFIDLEHLLLPDEITLGGTALGIASLPLRPIPWEQALLGGAVGFLVVWLPFIVGYRLLRGQAGMGFGDAKLLMLAGVWFGWPGALFALLAGAVQGTVIALAVFAVHGKIDEPEAVRKERELLKAELERLEGEERAALERELALDPVAQEPEEGLGKARIAFGPFLALGILEYLFLGDAVLAHLGWVLGGVTERPCSLDVWGYCLSVGRRLRTG